MNKGCLSASKFFKKELVSSDTKHFSNLVVNAFLCSSASLPEIGHLNCISAVQHLGQIVLCRGILM